MITKFTEWLIYEKGLPLSTVFLLYSVLNFLMFVVLLMLVDLFFGERFATILLVILGSASFALLAMLRIADYLDVYR